MVELAYALITPDELKTLQLTGHQVQAMAATWTTLGGVSVDQIRTSGLYNSHNTFTAFYLKDLTSNEVNSFPGGQLRQPNRYWDYKSGPFQVTPVLRFFFV